MAAPGERFDVFMVVIRRTNPAAIFDYDPSFFV
jgi:hypothetical protein